MKKLLIIKATYEGFYRSNQDLFFMILDKEKKLHYKDYLSRCCGGSAIDFIPEKCSTKYEGTLRKNVLFNARHFKIGEVLYLTCRIFKNVKGYGSEPFFAITNNSAVKPIL